jgi:hypothetical protein
MARRLFFCNSRSLVTVLPHILWRSYYAGHLNIRSPWEKLVTRARREIRERRELVVIFVVAIVIVVGGEVNHLLRMGQKFPVEGETYFVREVGCAA